MRPRAVGLLVTLGLLVVSLAVEAQPSAPVPRIGLLCLFSPAIGESKAESFRQGLRELGYIEGQNIRPRVPVGGGTPGEAGRARGRPGPHGGGRHRDRKHPSGAGSQAGHQHDSHCDGRRWRPGGGRAGGEPRPARGNCHRVNVVQPPS